MEKILIFATIIAPIISAIVQVIKGAINLPKNYVPVIAVVVGIIVGIYGSALTNMGLPLDIRIWAGILSGLTSVGIFEMINIREGTTKKDKN